jgi:FkbM family methyltransferase
MIYKLISKINKITGRILANKNLKDDAKKETPEKKWLSNFNTTNKFIFKLGDYINIFLYKDSVLAKLIYEGFEENELSFISRNLKNDDVFIDIGANIGLFSLIASPLVGENGKVIAFEPSPETYKRLTENISLNDFKNIDARNKGISDKKEKLNISISESGYDAWNTFAPGDATHFSKQVAVDVNTIDEELKNIDKSKIKIIKIDVEGWEKFVIFGGKNLLTQYSPIIMMEFTETNTFAAGYIVHELYDLMEDLGYKWYEYINGHLIKSPKKLHYPYNNLIAKKDN